MRHYQKSIEIFGESRENTRKGWCKPKNKSKDPFQKSRDIIRKHMETQEIHKWCYVYWLLHGKPCRIMWKLYQKLISRPEMSEISWKAGICTCPEVQDLSKACPGPVQKDKSLSAGQAFIFSSEFPPSFFFCLKTFWISSGGVLDSHWTCPNSDF